MKLKTDLPEAVQFPKIAQILCWIKEKYYTDQQVVKIEKELKNLLTEFIPKHNVISPPVNSTLEGLFELVELRILTLEAQKNDPDQSLRCVFTSYIERWWRGAIDPTAGKVQITNTGDDFEEWDDD